MDGWRAWFRALFRRRVEERELDEEIAFHLEMEARKLEHAGMSPAVAHREARRRFGGVERMKERTRDERGTRTLEDLWRDLHIAWRALRRDPGFSIPTAFTIALGIAAVTTVFTLVDGVLLRPLPYDEPGDLVEIRELGEGIRFFPSFPNFVDWRERSSSFASMTAVQPMGSQPILDAGDPVRLPIMMIAADFAATLGVPLEVGRDLAAEEHRLEAPPVALISHRFWMGRLGGVTELEQLSFTAFGQRYRVAGVLPPGFRLYYDADVFISAERWPGTVRSSHAYRVVGRLAPGMTLESADLELDAVTGRMKEEFGSETNAESVQLAALSDMVLGSHRRPLLMLLAAAGLVLLVACANVASTLLARGSTRARELAVRTSLGARRSRLVRQLLSESLLLTALAGVAGVGLAWVAVEAAVGMGSGALPRLSTVGLDARALAVSCFAALATAFLFGLYPALKLSSSSVSKALRGGGRGGSARRGRVWDGLIAVEVALAVVLLVGAGLLVRSLRSIVGMDAGWEPNGVVQMALTPPNGTFESEDEAIAYLDQVRRELRSLPSVSAVGMGTMAPLDAGAMTAPAHDPDSGREIGGYAGWRLVDGDYFDALSVRLIRGRVFRPGDARVAVVNESLARRLWGEEDPLGKRIVSNFDGPERAREVVGVTAVARDWRMADGQMEIYVPWWDRLDEAVMMRFFLRTDGDASQLMGAARERVRALNDRVPVEFTTLEEEFASSMADRRFVAAILSTFALLGLVLALLGIAGVVGYAVARRRREIGIRMALGARVSRVRAEVRREALVPTTLGLTVGLAASLALVRFMESLLYEVAPRDPGTLVTVALLFLVVAVVASDIPARRAASVDPAGVLREE